MSLAALLAHTAFQRLVLTALAGWAAAAERIDTGAGAVLVLYPDARIHALIIALDNTLRETVASAATRVAYYSELLDLVRFPSVEQEERLAAYLAAKYAGERIGAVICVRELALGFALRHRERSFPGVPIVHLAVQEPALRTLAVPAGVTGRPSLLDAEPTLALVRRLQPRASAIAVACGAGAYDRAWEASFRRALAGSAVPVRWLTGTTIAEAERAAAALPRDAALIVPLYTSDASGHAFVALEGMRRLFVASAAPTYGCYDAAIGEGALAGIVFDIDGAARDAARFALQAAAGAPPGEESRRPVVPDRALVDWRQLKRWGIAPSALPAGAVVRFREPDLWERYRGRILAVAGLLALQSALIVGLLAQHRRLRRATARLRESEQRMGMAVGAAKLCLWSWDMRSDEVWATPESMRAFGLGDVPRTDFATFVAHVHPDDRLLLEAATRRAIAGSGDYEAEYRIALPDGSVRWLAGRGRIERDPQGRPLRMLGVSIDISDRKRAEVEAERQRAELAHLARVASLGELSGSLAHEINQPLTASLSNAQAALRLLGRPQPPLQEVREILADVVRQDQRAGEVIRRMRGLLRRDEARRDPLDLNQVVRDVLSLLRSDLIVRNVACAAEPGMAPAPVVGDRVELQQVLINLIVNACEAMAGLPPERRRVVLRVVREGGLVRCDVVDSGTGIPPADLERIFEPFVSAKPQGVGMGLAICRSLVAAHGGTLVALNNPTGGATLRLELPATPGAGP